MRIWIGNEELAELLLSMDSEEALERLKGTAPAGALPEPCCRTRGAGRRQGDPLEYASELALPDQAERVLEALACKFEERAAWHEKEAGYYHQARRWVDKAEERGHAAGLVRAAGLLREALSAAQSDRSEGEPCAHPLRVHSIGYDRCTRCGAILETARGAGMERSGSGNAKEEARRK